MIQGTLHKNPVPLLFLPPLGWHMYVYYCRTSEKGWLFLFSLFHLVPFSSGPTLRSRVTLRSVILPTHMPSQHPLLLVS